MLLLLEEAIRRCSNSDLLFFETCYQWRFKKQVNLFGDILAWRTQQQVPSYVKEYLIHIYG
jgi:hypothetical protein